MWSRDEFRRQPCTLYDIHLPPHGPTAYWLSDWQVDYSQHLHSTTANFSPLLAERTTAPVTPPVPLTRSQSASRWELEWTRCEETDDEAHHRHWSSSPAANSPLMAHLEDSLDIVVTQSPPSKDPEEGGEVAGGGGHHQPLAAAAAAGKRADAYAGTTEGFVVPRPICDDKGWQYASNLSSR